MFYRKVYRFHQAETGRGSVAGVHVNMPTPEAFRTVIGIAVSLDRGTTLHAGEIFNVALESFVHVRYSKALYSLLQYLLLGIYKRLDIPQ